MTPEAKAAKEYLEQVYKLEQKIKKKKEKIKILESKVKHNSPNNSDMPKPEHSGNGMEISLHEYIDKKAILESNIGKLEAEKQKLTVVFEKQIDLLDKEKYLTILRLRFIDCCTWEQIADVMDYLNAKSLPPVCNRALEKFYKINQNFFKNGS